MSSDPYFTPTPESIERAAMTCFARHCSDLHRLDLSDPLAFHRWSVSESGLFWSTLLQWSGVRFEGEVEPVTVGEGVEATRFFPRLRLSYAENLLRDDVADEDAIAVVSLDERGSRAAWTRRALRTRVIQMALALRARGVEPGDRVVAIAQNTADTIVAALACTALGASWSSVNADLGDRAILARFRQLEPRILFTHLEHPYQGRSIDLVARIGALVRELPTLELVFTMGAGDLASELPVEPMAALFDESREIDTWTWPRFAFDHPLFILFSSGTTGAPKCIVHGHGGTLLEHFKEQRLHSDLGPDDRLYFHTSCGWMMWNWLVSALQCGTTILLREGSPTHPTQDALWQMLAEEEATVFGTSPTYLQFCADSGLRPREGRRFPSLRAIQSTGSVLYERHYDWISSELGPLAVQSISGGTDILGCFVLGHPGLPVYRGESQSISLAMDVRALTPDGQPDATPELICANAFPSRPVRFHNDPDRSRFHDAYFSANPGVWSHGDFVRIHPRGSVRILGRSDGVLNIRGIRIGPAEIYLILQDIPQIRAALAVEQREATGEGRLVLLVQLRDGTDLDRPLILAIKKAIKLGASAAHVPAVIAAVSELPTTFSGKLSERAARDCVNGLAVANESALRNPGCLEEIRGHPDLDIGARSSD